MINSYNLYKIQLMYHVGILVYQFVMILVSCIIKRHQLEVYCRSIYQLEVNCRSIYRLEVNCRSIFAVKIIVLDASWVDENWVILLIEFI